MVAPPERPASEDPLSIFSRAADSFRAYWLAKTYPFASFGKNPWINYACDIARSAAPFISIGDNVGLGRGVRLDASPRVRESAPILTIENDCWLQRRTTISAWNRVHLMPYVMCAHSVLICDHNPDEDRTNASCGSIKIEDNCWIGFGVQVICQEGELVIGRHSVIAANCIIRNSIPPYSVVAGDPPRIVRQYDHSKQKWVIGSIRA